MDQTQVAELGFDYQVDKIYHNFSQLKQDFLDMKKRGLLDTCRFQSIIATMQKKMEEWKAVSDTLMEEQKALKLANECLREQNHALKNHSTDAKALEAAIQKGVEEYMFKHFSSLHSQMLKLETNFNNLSDVVVVNKKDFQSQIAEVEKTAQSASTQIHMNAEMMKNIDAVMQNTVNRDDFTQMQHYHKTQLQQLHAVWDETQNQLQMEMRNLKPKECASLPKPAGCSSPTLLANQKLSASRMSPISLHESPRPYLPVGVPLSPSLSDLSPCKSAPPVEADKTTSEGHAIKQTSPVFGQSGPTPKSQVTDIHAVNRACMHYCEWEELPRTRTKSISSLHSQNPLQKEGFGFRSDDSLPYFSSERMQQRLSVTSARSARSCAAEDTYMCLTNMDKRDERMVPVDSTDNNLKLNFGPSPSIASIGTQGSHNNTPRFTTIDTSLRGTCVIMPPMHQYMLFICVKASVVMRLL
eukprot:Platyproteum_vivax@DN4163_c0_g1_i3.p1